MTGKRQVDVYGLTDQAMDDLGVPGRGRDEPTRRPAATNGGYGAGRPRFSRTDLRDIIAAHNAGETKRSIARRYGCTPEAIRYQLRRHLADDPPPGTGVSVCTRCGIDTPHPGICTDCADVLDDLGETWR